MMKNKYLSGILALTVSLSLLGGTGVLLAKDAPFSVRANDIEYDMETGAGFATGKTIIVQDGATTTAGAGGTFNSKNKSGHLKGGIVSDRGDEHLRSSELIIHNENFISAVGNANITKGDKTLISNQVDYHKDSGFMETIGSNARLVSTDGSWLNASKITYEMNAGVANATGGVTLASPPRDLTADADRAVYETKNGGHIDLIGNAHAVQKGNSVAGNRLRINNTNSHTQAEGNVRMVYHPEKQPAKGTKGTAVAATKTKENTSVLTGNTKAGAKTVHGTAKAEVIA
jgi:lipopolysaccharide export system protein LptA